MNQKNWILSGVIAGMTISLAGCTGEAAAVSSASTASASFAPKEAIKIDEIDWSVENAVINDERCMSLNYTNNSSYKILSLELECEVKDDVTIAQLQKLNDFRSSDKWTDEELKKLTFEGTNEKFADPGESVSDARCSLNGAYSRDVNKDVYDLFEPSMMKIVFAGPDDKGYEVTYDFIGDAYGISSHEGVDLHKWSDSTLASLLPQPGEDFVNAVSSDQTEYFYAYVYGMSADDYKAYVKETEEKGFDQNEQDYNTDVYVNNAAGQRLNLGYSAEKECMSITLFQK